MFRSLGIVEAGAARWGIYDEVVVDGRGMNARLLTEIGVEHPKTYAN